MPLLEDTKRAFERLTGLGSPERRDLPSFVRPRKPNTYFFKDDGKTPNNPKWPLIFYRSPVLLREGLDPAAIFEELFAKNGWKDSWRDSIYDYLHFHTGTHEVLGIARGTARAQFGGAKGRMLDFKAGDVVILPAGTGHRRLRKSHDLLVVGAYPANGSYDEPRPSEVNHAKAVAAVAKVRRPQNDPVYGTKGGLLRVWRNR